MMVQIGRRKRRVALASSVLVGLGCLTVQAAEAQPAPAASDQTRAYHVGAQSLDTALQEFATQSGLQLLFSKSDVAGLKTDGLEGNFSAEQALQRLLQGSGLNFEFPKPDAVVIRRANDNLTPAGNSSQSATDFEEAVTTRFNTMATLSASRQR